MLSTNRYCYSASSLTCLGLLCTVALEVKMLVFVGAAVNHLSIVFCHQTGLHSSQTPSPRLSPGETCGTRSQSRQT